MDNKTGTVYYTWVITRSHTLSAQKQHNRFQTRDRSNKCGKNCFLAFLCEVIRARKKCKVSNISIYTQERILQQNFFAHSSKISNLRKLILTSAEPGFCIRTIWRLKNSVISWNTFNLFSVIHGSRKGAPLGGVLLGADPRSIFRKTKYE